MTHYLLLITREDCPQASKDAAGNVSTLHLMIVGRSDLYCSKTKKTILDCLFRVHREYLRQCHL